MSGQAAAEDQPQHERLADGRKRRQDERDRRQDAREQRQDEREARQDEREQRQDAREEHWHELRRAQIARTRGRAVDSNEALDRSRDALREGHLLLDRATDRVSRGIEGQERVAARAVREQSLIDAEIAQQ